MFLIECDIIFYLKVENNNVFIITVAIAAVMEDDLL